MDGLLSLVSMLVEVEKAYNEFEAAHQECHETVVGHDKNKNNNSLFRHNNKYIHILTVY